MKVAIYCRLSKEDTDRNNKINNSSESIKNQKKLLEDYVIANQWDIFDFYVDDDYKGSDRNRPEFNRMLSDAMLQKINIIICKQQSRFARDIEFIERYIHGVFVEKGIRFIALLDNIDTGSANNSTRKVSQINGLKDTWYLEDLSASVDAALTSKRKNGEYIGSWALYGYFKAPEDKNKLVVDPDAAEVVKEIFDLYISGNGIGRIAAILNGRGVPNPMLYKKQLGMKIGAPSRLTSKSYLWRNSTISEMLKNRMYIGDMVQGRMKKVSYKSKKLIRLPEEDWTIVPHTHIGIVDEETFYKVQHIRKGKLRARSDGTFNMFVGKLRCLECGELLHAVKYSKKKDNKPVGNEKYTMFRCSKRMMNPDSCDGNGITMQKIEEHILAEINKLSESYYDETKISEKVMLNDQREELIQKLNTSLEQLQIKSKEYMDAISLLYMDKTKGLISEDEFSQIKTKMQESKAETEDRLTDIKEQLVTANKRKANTDSIADIVKKYRTLENLTREIIIELIDVIYIGKKEPDGRTIKIIWNF